MNARIAQTARHILKMGMRITIDEETQKLIVETAGQQTVLPLYSDEAFDVVSQAWLRVGWNQKYSYTFSWFGRPIIQLPEDLIRIQEVIYRVKPDVIIETGIAHGGSLVFYASLCKAMEKGRVIGIDIEIRPHNREAIERHELSSYITLVEGSSTAPAVVEAVTRMVKPSDRVLVLLDSNHTCAHVLEELRAYGPLVNEGSYIVATDGLMRDLSEVPRGRPSWREDNPCTAIAAFLSEHPEFRSEQPPWPFNESTLEKNITHWPDAYLRKIAPSPGASRVGGNSN